MLSGLNLPEPTFDSNGFGGMLHNLLSGDNNTGLLALSMLSGRTNPLAMLALMNDQKPERESLSSAGNQPSDEPKISFRDQGDGFPKMSLPTDRQALLQTLKENAARAYPGNALMQQVAMTQAIHESGLLSKPSHLASRYNNLFGIKAPGTAGTVNMPTNEEIGGVNQRVSANFGANASPLDSFMQHRNLMNNQRYKPVLAAHNPYDAFAALKAAGYATDSQYSDKLSNIYNRYVAPLYGA
jgi:flagellum-specific peptidoglycan hydrolase FlgJ